MDSAIIKYIIDNWPALAGLIILSYGVWKVSRTITKWEDKNDQRHKDSDKRHEAVEDTLKEISKRVGTIERFLIKNGGADYNEFTQMNSPRQLNPKGRKLYHESGAESFFGQKKGLLLETLSGEMDKMDVKTALDVEILAQRVCLEASHDEDFKPIKDFIYTHPVFEGANVSLDTIAMLMGLELRNEYLRENPGIDPTSE